MRISQAVSLLITEAKSRRLTPATVLFYEREYKSLCDFLNDADVKNITVHDLRAYIGQRSARSAPNAYKVIKRLFRFLSNEGDIIMRDPSEKLARPKVQKLVTKPLNRQQVKLCYETAKRWHGYLGVRDGAMFALMVGTGIRREELCLLKDDDVDLHGDHITVNGKGQKQRLVPISPKLKMILAKYKLLRSDTRVYGREETPWFFRDRRGYQMKKEAVTQMIRRLSHEVGFRVYPHLLRHTFCSEYMSHDGADIMALKELVGWSTLSMAQIYVKPSLEKLQRSMEAFSPINDL